MIEIRFQAKRELQTKLEKIKGLLAHSKPDLNMEGMLNFLADLAIEKLDPGVKKSSSPQQDSRSAPALKRRISAAVRRLVWERAESRCEHCHSQHALQIDHRTPLSLGGTSAPENLRLLCRTCNQRAAINRLGMSKMESFIN
jgi:hypothetical protein